MARAPCASQQTCEKNKQNGRGRNRFLFSLLEHGTREHLRQPKKERANGEAKGGKSLAKGDLEDAVKTQLVKSDTSGESWTGKGIYGIIGSWGTIEEGPPAGRI